MRIPVLVFMLVFSPLRSRAEEPRIDAVFLESLIPNLELISNERDQGATNLSFRVSEKYDRANLDLAWNLDVFAGTLPVLRTSAMFRDEVVRVSIRDSDLAESRHLMFVATFQDDRERLNGYLYLLRTDSGLTQETLLEYMNGLSENVDGTMVFQSNGVTLPPLGKDVLDSESQLPGQIPRSLDPDGATPAASDEPTGCAGGAAVSYLFCALALLARRRFFTGLAFLGVVMTQSPARATVVKGTVMFWDTRLGSDLPGSQRDQCNQNNTSCTPGSADCCFRPLPLLKASIYKKNGPIVATTTVDSLGKFQFPNATYQAGALYQVFVTFERDAWPTKQHITLTFGFPSVSTTAGNNFAVPTTSPYDAGFLSVNPAQDPSSQAGNLATIWHAMTMTWIAVEFELEISQRKVLGSPNAYDDIEIQYQSTGSDVWCPSTMLIAPSASRSNFIGEYNGWFLLFRKLGCSFQNQKWPRGTQQFYPGMQPQTETGALLFGFNGTVSLLGRFDPNSTSMANLKAGTNLDCFYDTLFGVDQFPNSNSASWFHNNMFALWEFLDADTSQSDDGVNDTVNTTLSVVMQAMYNNMDNDGLPAGTNWAYEEFVANNAGLPCEDNEDCLPGQACYGFVGQCFTGDPNGGNIGDLIHFLQPLLGSGNAEGTAKSSKCMRGNPVNSPPFNGSYRSD